MDLSKATQKLLVEDTLLAWLAVHECVCLALRDPVFIPAEAAGYIETFVIGLGEALIQCGIATREEIESAEQFRT